MTPDTLIVIPAYNEEESLEQVVLDLLQANAGADILVVNDGSHDRTLEIAQRLPIHVVSHPSNLGYGASVQSGYRFALQRGYGYVVQYDADGQHTPRDLKLVMAELRESGDDVIIGSRFLGDPNFHPGVLKSIAITFFNALIQLFTGKRVTDPTSGLRGLSRKAFSYYAGRMRFPSECPDADIIIHMLLTGFRLREIPIGSKARTTGVSQHSGLKPAVYFMKMLFSIVAVLLQHLLVERRRVQ
ncbi:glycosyltransferase family 2 protein [Paenibacillus sp.]|uniref:glycosyltransferase family 2 protein n=1 Tax=Paenibacillus sp. TaxID=58172 RepID=UPI002D6B0F9E|nr:glycosyltransferase family 2 protein [Paenibacillus sp.]HZG58493.1 glycosyltransferase family 2 protein [Paenibacillus sp.]